MRDFKEKTEDTDRLEQIAELKLALNSPKDISIVMHRNPDGDAIGSTLGLYHLLTDLKHSVFVISPSEYPDTFYWMDGVNDIMIYDIEPERVKEVLERSDMVFCLDFNSLDRIDKVGELIAPLACEKVMIDHHLYPEPFADYMFSDTTASSTCEMVYNLIIDMGYSERLDVRIGDCLFTGILTDTGSFKYSTSAKLFRIVADLLDRGVDDYQLQDLIFNSLKEKHLRLLGHCLHERMKILDKYQTGIIWLTKEDYADLDIKRGDTEGIVNFILKIKNIKMAVFIMEQPTIIKISLRSKGDFSVQEIAKRYFKGGGHKNASGGFFYGKLEDVMNRFENVILPRIFSEV